MKKVPNLIRLLMSLKTAFKISLFLLTVQTILAAAPIVHLTVEKTKVLASENEQTIHIFVRDAKNKVVSSDSRTLDVMVYHGTGASESKTVQIRNGRGEMRLVLNKRDTILLQMTDSTLGTTLGYPVIEVQESNEGRLQ